MMIFKEELLEQAKVSGYKPEILEKVVVLLNVMYQFMSIPYLRDRLALKGGTAINLFHFSALPRLSIDIDFNYIGHLSRSDMLKEKVVIQETIQKVLEQNQYVLDRNRDQHAGGKMIWRYKSALGQNSNLEIDINYMYRQPLWDIEWKYPNLKTGNSAKIPVLNIHELMAGKLSALFSRLASRDIFDAHYLLTKHKFSINKLRTAFITYIAMSNIALSDLREDYITCSSVDVRSHLLPLLQQNFIPKNRSTIQQWIGNIIEELRSSLKAILPLTDDEIEFIDSIRKGGLVKPELITTDAILAQKIMNHSAIKWSTFKKKAK